MKSVKRPIELEDIVDMFRELSADTGFPSPAQLLQYVMHHDSRTSLQEIGRHFGVEGEGALDEILRRLCTLEDTGLLESRKGDWYRVPEDVALKEGTVEGSPGGYGSVAIGTADDEAHRIGRSQMRRVLHGDRVLCLVDAGNGGRRMRIKVLGVLNRLQKSLAGEIRVVRGEAMMIPLDSRFCHPVAVARDRHGKASEGDIVNAVLTSAPFAPGPVRARIVEVVGNLMVPGVRTTMALIRHEIPSCWPDDVLKEIDGDRALGESPSPGRDREDLRGLPFITIDGDDARDFDDAVYCSEIPSGWRLVVAIADVSHYVRTGSAIDRQAYARGTSVYFPDKVVPMLPEHLSNGICSLNPKEDRNCLICDISIDRDHEISGYRFYQAVMKSRARMTYDRVEELLNPQHRASSDEDEALLENLRNLESMATGLEASRMRRGSIAFELPESRIDLTEDGRIASIGMRERLRSHKIIEECMLAANRCAAGFLHLNQGDMALYRVHPGPSRDDVLALRRDLRTLGLALGGGAEPDPASYRTLLEQAEGEIQLFGAVQLLLLRSMGQALYTPVMSDHFALGFPAYTHFTSPIRRYGDLVVHRLIKQSLGLPGYRDLQPSVMSLEETCAQCSMTERRADAAVNEVIAWLKALYMLHRIGSRFSGTVTGVKEYGLFIRLDELFVDGLAHVSKLGYDYFVFDEDSQTLYGEHTNVLYRLGDRVKVEVLDVDLDESRVSFSLLDENLFAYSGDRRRKRRRNRYR
ncbi:MAG: ribonuclease R [Gammaproteobacteria bacterium]|nr:ribonuclease R [Gammaproteobacteria bacterium]MYD76381.1 ribonuclease R [Gammaproteobacteria bacterium]MYJ52962.1 ribonuclease R [Gammaproteobacteria bacterium]